MTEDMVKCPFCDLGKQYWLKCCGNPSLSYSGVECCGIPDEMQHECEFCEGVGVIKRKELMIRKLKGVDTNNPFASDENYSLAP